MTPLARILAERIRATGPISLADYMAECLLHPVHGYYTTRPPFGTEGDFTTAPEISQMFGELLGLCLAQAWLDQGAPSRFTLAELGPGRGTLMADVLRATKGVPGFHEAARVVLVEASPTLRRQQEQTIARAGLRWIEAASDLPDQPLFLIANEFFDALPIRQFQRDGAGWRERVIGLRDGALTFGLTAPVDPALLGPRSEPAGTILEICPLARPIIGTISHRLHHHGGLALILDYGGWNGTGDTFQALRHHAFADPLAEPGMADLTAHVDFAALAAATPGLTHHYTTQGALLTALGIHPRADRLAQSLTGAALTSHRAAERRLTHPSEMGELFKALALTGPAAPPPAGFA